MDEETKSTEVEETEGTEVEETEEIEETEGTEVEETEGTESIEDRLSAMFDEIKQGISDLRDLIGEVKAMRIESGAEVIEDTDTDIERIDDDPEPVSIDELDLTM